MIHLGLLFAKTQQKNNGQDKSETPVKLLTQNLKIIDVFPLLRLFWHFLHAFLRCYTPQKQRKPRYQEPATSYELKEALYLAFDDSPQEPPNFEPFARKCHGHL